MSRPMRILGLLAAATLARVAFPESAAAGPGDLLTRIIREGWTERQLVG